MKSFNLTAQLATYTVKFAKRKIAGFDPKQNDGLCDFNTKTIYISDKLTDDCKMVTLWHEFCHAILSELDRDELTYNEPFVETLSQNIARAIRMVPKEFK